MSVSDEEWNEINENYINELKAEIERLRGALQAYESECLCRLTETRCERCKGALQALEGETK